MPLAEKLGDIKTGCGRAAIDEGDGRRDSGGDLSL